MNHFINYMRRDHGMDGLGIMILVVKFARWIRANFLKTPDPIGKWDTAEAEEWLGKVTILHTLENLRRELRRRVPIKFETFSWRREAALPCLITGSYHRKASLDSDDWWAHVVGSMKQHDGSREECFEWDRRRQGFQGKEGCKESGMAQGLARGFTDGTEEFPWVWIMSRRRKQIT